MTREKINRINELAKKSKITGLTLKEKEEQARLRNEYISDVRSNFVKSIENVVVIDENGNRHQVKKKADNINLQWIGKLVIL